MTSDAGILSCSSLPRYPVLSSIVVGNGSLLPVTSTSTATLSALLHINNVLISPYPIKNFISVHQFTSDNNYSMEVDPAGCSVKDLLSWKTTGAIASGRCTLFVFPPPCQAPFSPSHSLLFGASVILVMRRYLN